MGVSLFISKNLNCKLIAASGKDDHVKIEYILAAITFNSSTSTALVGVFYIPPSVVSSCKEYLFKTFSDHYLSYVVDDVIFVRDFNMDLLSSVSSEMKTITASLNLHIVPSAATRHGNDCNSSVLDYFITNNLDKIQRFNQVHIGFTNHEFIFIRYNAKPPASTAETIEFHDFNCITHDLDKFLVNADGARIYTSKCCNTKVDLLDEILRKAFF